MVHQGRGSARRRPMPCKGHKKSRLGCATCKGRRVKCDEAAPQCGPCLRLGLSCEYKTNTTMKGSRESSVGVGMESLKAGNGIMTLGRRLSSTPVFIDRENLRFFSHFLLTAYPPLPLAGRAIWGHVSRMSHEYDFLMHSMLALGASHLSLISPEGYTEVSLKHRVAAINGLNEFLSQPHSRAAHADAALGTMLALTFQSSHLPDGLMDFLTTVRGCYLISSAENFYFEDSQFAAFQRGSYQEKLTELVNSHRPQRCLDQAIAESFRASIERLAPLCKSITEVEYLSLLRRIVSTSAADPVWGHAAHTEKYDKLGTMTSEEFASFSDPKNNVGRLLIMHSLILDVIMSRRIVEEQGPRGVLTSAKAIAVIWIEKIAENLSDEYRTYSEWAVGFMQRWDFSRDMEDIAWTPIERGVCEIED